MENEFVKEIEQKTEEIKKAQQDMVDLLKPKFQNLFVPFMEKWKIDKVFWTQYTPYFNDGETCEFSVNDLEFSVEDLGEESWISETLANNEEWNTHFGSKEQTLEFVKEWKELSKVFSNLPEETMRSLFGDHAQVFVDKTGVDVEEYEHD